MTRDDPPMEDLKAAMEEMRLDVRAARAEVRVELGEAGRETRAALREAMAEVRAAWAEVRGRPGAGRGRGDDATRLSRARRKEMTRELLLDAAVEVFARKGYEGASLDDVAEAAGFTKGAVYSNFTRKSELFRALLERETGRRGDAMRAAVAAVPIEFLPAYAAEWIEHHARDLRDLDILTVEFWLAAVRDPAIASQLDTGGAAGIDALGAALERKLSAAKVDAGLSGHELAVVLDALGTGLLMDQHLHPERPRAEVFARAVRKLLADVGRSTEAAGGADGPASEQPGDQSGASSG
jgi:AcrR family transcriptional regulator